MSRLEVKKGGKKDRGRGCEHLVFKLFWFSHLQACHLTVSLQKVVKDGGEMSFHGFKQRT